MAQLTRSFYPPDPAKYRELSFAIFLIIATFMATNSGALAQTLSACPGTVYAAEGEIIVTYLNAPGDAGQWVGMYYILGSTPSLVSQQSTNNGEYGSLKFSTPANAGEYEFRLYNAQDQQLAMSNRVGVIGELSPQLPPEGLIAYWNFDEGHGTTLADSVNGINGEIYGASWTDGVSGGALSFGDWADTVGMPDSDVLDLTTQFTLEAWVYPYLESSPWGDAAVISKVGGAGGNNGYQFGLGPDYKSICIIFNAANEEWAGNVHCFDLENAVPANQWSYIAATYDNENVRVYLNGDLVGSPKYVGPKSIVNSASNFRISGDDNNHVYFHGRVDEVRVYNIAVSQGELQERYRNISSSPIPSTPFPCIAVYPKTISAGDSILITIDEAPGNATDWIGIYPAGTSNEDYFSFYYLNGQKRGSLPLYEIPATASDGVYEIRMFPNDQYDPVLASTTLVVGDISPPTTPTGSYSADMVAYWRFDDGSGSVAVDSTGNGHDGDLVGNIKWVTGKIGSAVEFDGNSVIEVPHASDLNLQKFSLMAWFKVSVNTGNWQTIICKEGIWPARNYGVFISATNGTIHHSFVTGGFNNMLDSTFSVIDGKWHHVCATYDGSSMKTYIDGTLNAESSLIGIPDFTDAKVTIGSSPANLFLDGLIDEVAIFNGALKGEEVRNVVKQGIQIGGTAPTAETCEEFPGHSYLVVEQAMTWSEAKAYAEQQKDDKGRSGHLVTISNHAENKCVVDMALRRGLKEFWIGLTDEEQENVFKWITGAALDNSWSPPWYPGEPNDMWDGEDYATAGYFADDRYAWNDAEHDTLNPFVIEFDDGEGQGATSEGLIAHWKLDEGQGTEARDSVGGNHGTVGGPYKWEESGVVGGSLKFEDSSSTPFDSGRVLVSDSNRLNLGNRFTLEAWVKPASSHSGPSISWGAAIISKVSESTGRKGYQLRVSYDMDKIILNFSGEGESWGANYLEADLGNGKLQMDQWYYIVATYDNEYIRIYLDGALVNNAEKSVGPKDVSDSGARFRISGNDNGDLSFHGSMDEVRIHNIALSETEIKNRYEELKSGSETILVSTETCPEVPEHSYYVEKQAMTWLEAEAYAKKLRNAGGAIGHLAAIGSSEENQCVIDIAGRSGITNFWIGLTDKDREGTFTWVTGEPLNYTNWHTSDGQPDNNLGAEHYVEVGYHHDQPDTWNDNTSFNLLPFVVEFEGSGSGETILVSTETCSEVSGHSYYVEKQTMTWKEAEAYAKKLRDSEGRTGYLATIANAGENDCVVRLANDKGVTNFWIGLTDEEEEGTFTWITDEPLNYTNWHASDGQPDNYLGVEHYAEVGHPSHNDQPGSWNDNNGRSNLGFVVEFGEPGSGGTGSPADMDVLVLTGNVRQQEFPVLEKFTDVNGAKVSYEQTKDRELPGLDETEVLWLGHREICADGYSFSSATEGKIKSFVQSGGIVISVGQDSDTSRPCQTGWLSAPILGIERADDDTPNVENLGITNAPEVGNLFTNPNRVTSAHFQDVWTNPDPQYAVLATVDSQYVAIALLKYGNGFYIVTSIENETASDVSINAPLMENLIHYAASLSGGGGTGSTTEGLVSHWRFDEGQGTEARDSVDGNHGQVKTPISQDSPWKEGKTNGALGFYDYNYVQVKAANNLDLTDAFTLETWVYPDILRLSDGVIISKRVSRLDDPGWESGYELLVSKDLDQVTMSFHDAGNSSTEIKLVVDLKQLFAEGKITGDSVPYWQWSHIVSTYDSNNGYLRIYINGVLFGERDVGLKKVATSDSDLWFGSNNKKNFYGRIDEVKIYNVALSATEVENNYKGITGGGGTTPSDTPKITTIAGGGSSTSNGIQATQAFLDNPSDIFVDSSGRLFIAEYEGHRVRRVDTDGTITTIAGTGVAGYSGDDGPATSAKLNNPHKVFVDPSGNVFIADLDNHRIRRIDGGTGIITTVVGTGKKGSGGDGGCATDATISNPSDVFIDSSGNMFISEYTEGHRIRRVDGKTGIISTVAGTGVSGYSGDDGPATDAKINRPHGIFVSSSGELLIADRRNHCIRNVDMKLVPSPITTIAGTGQRSGSSGDGGSAKNAFLNEPTDAFIDSKGNIFITDTYNNRIRRVDPSGNISTVVGTGISGSSGDDGDPKLARIDDPEGLFIDSKGDLYIADYENNRIRRVEGIAEPTTLNIGQFNPECSGSTSPSTKSSIIKVVVDPIHPVGTDFWVTIQVGDENSPVENLFGVSFKLNYTNTSIIDATGNEAGNFLGTDIIFFPNIDDSAGTVSIANSKKSGTTGANGSGTVARIRMKFNSTASNGDRSSLTLTDIRANDPEGNPITLTPQGATVEAGGMLVWPGDADNNGKVDGLDVFPIGRYWLSTGPARSSPSTQWTGQTATAWSPEAATYADANGDGTIDEGDTLAIGLNWGKTHGSSPPASPMRIASMNHAPYVCSYEELLKAMNGLPNEEAIVDMRKVLREAISIGKRQIIPENTAILQNYPNPFNPETWIPFQLAEDAEVRITIYNVSGQLVRILELGNLGAGTYTDKYSAAHWDGRNNYGEQSSSDIYFCHFQAGNFNAIKKMILAK